MNSPFRQPTESEEDLDARIADDEGLPLCPNCGEPATFTEHSGDFTETHGLDCGPYEHWHEEWAICNKCGAKTDWKEIAAAQPKEAA